MCPAAAASSRWCPTPEQFMILEEIYRGGMKTPNASHIQQITTHLSLYGKIEGKNVFYWFQNHKARDRLKLRRKLTQQRRRRRRHHHEQYHHLLPYLESPPLPPPPPPPPQLSRYTSFGFLPQGGVEDPSTETETMSYRWKFGDLPERWVMDKSMARTYGPDWTTMLDVGPITPTCNKPLKTLQLFPITATALNGTIAPTN